MSRTGETVCWAYFNKMFFLIFAFCEIGIIALTTEDIEHSSEEQQQFAVVFIYILFKLLKKSKIFSYPCFFLSANNPDYYSIRELH